MNVDAVVIGAGPAGSTAALLLARAGWSVAIVEKKTFPRGKVCGEFISASSLPLLRELGIDNFYFSQSGPQIYRIGLFAQDLILTAAMPPAYCQDNHSKWGRAIGRKHLDMMLLETAVQAGAKLWQPFTALNLQRNANKFVCTVASNNQQQKICADRVIIAQGSWERNLVSNLAKSHKNNDLLAFKNYFQNCNFDSDLMPLITFPGGYGGLVHTDGGLVTLSCCIRRDTLQRIRKQYPGAAGEAVFKHIIQTNFGVRQALGQAECYDRWLSVGPLQPGIRHCYANGIFFVGNIAGEAHPIVAEGISMAMQSSWLLAQSLIACQNKLHQAKVLTEVGRCYTQNWRAQFSRRLYTAALLAQLAMRPQVVAMLLPFLKIFPQSLTIGAKLSGKIKPVLPLG